MTSQEMYFPERERHAAAVTDQSYPVPSDPKVTALGGSATAYTILVERP